MLNLSSEGSRYAHQAAELHRQTLRTIWLMNIYTAGYGANQSRWFSPANGLDCAGREIIGSALKSLKGIVVARYVRLDLPREMILLRADGPLLERTFVNLLENKQNTPPARGRNRHPGEKRTIRDTLKITVLDNKSWPARE